jgi:hypothetical protein
MEGFSVIETKDGVEALKALSDDCHDIVDTFYCQDIVDSHLDCVEIIASGS